MTDLETKIEIAQSKWLEVQQGSPNKDSDWGFFSYGDAPGGIGGGVGVFIWFSTIEEGLNFIKDVLPYSPPGQSDLDWDDVATRTSGIVANIKSGSIELNEGVKQLNNTLRTFSQIEWVGTFSELVNGEHEYAKSVRSDFFEIEDEEFNEGQPGSERDPERPISSDSISNFKEFLNNYGF